MDLVKAMVFPVVMYGQELGYKRKLSTEELMVLNCGAGEDSWVPWTARRSNQSILKGITLLIVSFVVQKLLSFIRSHLFIFAFISSILGGGP